MFNEYPRVAIIGDTGEGKTTTMVSLAIMYQKQGKKIFSNMELYGVDYTHMNPAEIVKFPPELHDCVILTDEIHIDMSRYKFYTQEVQDMGDFATQTRKRKIIWLYTTQVFLSLTKSLRDLTTNLIYCKKVKDDIFQLKIYNRDLANNGYIKTLYLHGTPFYKYFDTTQIIKKTIKNKESKK